MSKKLLAILQELSKALEVPKEIADEISNYKSDDDIDEGKISQALKDAHRGKLDILSRNSAVELKKEKDAAYKAAERKVKTMVENQLKEKFDLTDSEAEDLETLVDEALTKTAGKAGKKQELSDDAVKTHPLYVQLEKNSKKALKEATDKAAQDIEAVKSEYQQKETFSEVATEGLKLFKEMNPILSSDPEKAKNQEKLVLDKLGGYKYQKVEGEWVITDNEGKVLENELKEKLKFQDHLKNLVNPIFDFKVAEERKTPQGSTGGNPAGNPGGGQPTNGFSGKLPTNKRELTNMLVDDNIEISQRQELRKWADTNEASLAE